MTLPRQILPGRSYLITRRCTQRQFLLRPSRVTNQNVEYCLALAAERTGMLLHAVCVMSNHWHGVVTDPEGRLPKFLEIFHKLVAKAQNASLGRWENLWSSDKTSAVPLVSEADVLEKMAYTLANPRIASKSTPARVDAIRRMLAFVQEYRAAWHEWRAGSRDVLFPPGTYALRIYARVACAPAVPA